MFAETALDIGHLYRSINQSINRDVMPDGLTGQQYKILRYISAHSRERDVYLCEIETKLGICRSTASGLVTELEAKGLLRREALEDDARFKRLLLTDAGYDVINHVVIGIDGLNQSISKDISNEEMQAFHQVAAKIRRNLEMAAAI